LWGERAGEEEEEKEEDVFVYTWKGGTYG